MIHGDRISIRLRSGKVICRRKADLLPLLPYLTGQIPRPRRFRVFIFDSVIDRATLLSHLPPKTKSTTKP